MANESRIEPIMEDWVLGFIVLDSREANGRSQAAKGELKSPNGAEGISGW